MVSNTLSYSFLCCGIFFVGNTVDITNLLSVVVVDMSSVDLHDCQWALKSPSISPQSHPEMLQQSCLMNVLACVHSMSYFWTL